MRAAASNVHHPAANTAAVVTIAYAAGRRVKVSGIAWSYDGSPAAATTLSAAIDGSTVWGVDIVAAGPGDVTFAPPIDFTPATTSVVFTLPAGGAGVSGKLNVLTVPG